MELYGYNKETCDKAIEVLERTNKCAVLQAPGLGKTYITMQLLLTIFKDKSVLYVVPTMSIAHSIRMYEEWKFGNVDFVTYTNLKNIKDEYDVLILDELHRAGAPTWQRYVLNMWNKFEYVLGLSATPYRFLDGKRDMATELFGDSVVWGPDIEQAIERKIYPGFDYWAILSDTMEIVDQINNLDPNKEIKERIAGLRLDEYNLAERIKEHVNPEHKKIIVFYPDTDTLERADIDLYNWFGGDTEIYSLYSRLSDKDNKNNLSRFNASNSRCVLKVIDMANEGIHIKGVTLLVFARKTVSGNVFIQQLGRALSASNKSVRPTIIDLVQNYNNIKVLKKCIPSAKIANGTRCVMDSADNETTVDITKVLVSYDDVLLELDDILAKVKDKWTDEEDSILKEYYKYDGSEVYKRLQGKTKSECSKRVKLLGLTKNRGWTEDEDNILREYYDSDRDSIWRRLPGRTQGAIDSRARKLGLVTKWYPEEDLKLMKYWDTMRYDLLQLLPRHGLQDMLERAKKLGLER